MTQVALVPLGVVSTLVPLVGTRIELGWNICPVGAEGGAVASSWGNFLQCVLADCKNSKFYFLQ